MADVERDLQDYKLRIRAVHEELVTRSASHQSSLQSLMDGRPTLKDLIDCGGAALVRKGNVAADGATPTTEQILDLAEWFRERGDPVGEVFATHELPAVHPAAAAFAETAAGVAIAPISAGRHDLLMWFRPEAAPGQGKSKPWLDVETDAAVRMRHSLLDVVIRHADEIAKLNRELEATIDEMDAFVYIASHDLKEPLRGIHNYASFLLEDYEGKLDADGDAKLHALMRLTQRMEALIDSLLHYSRMGRGEMTLRERDLNAIVRDSLELLHVRIEESGAEIRIPRPLPTVRCDAVRIGEVFTNLIGNALKYNDKKERWVEIGYRLLEPSDRRDASAYEFYVRDNGIGIPKKHHDSIFRIFKRLHARDKFGGGTGAGLSIVKRMVERHGGCIRVESEEGVGSTFYFTLGV